MECPQDFTLQLAVENKLTVERIREISEHLDVCQKCSEKYNKLLKKKMEEL